MRILCVATFVWSEWQRFCDLANGNSWAYLDRRQAYIDCLQALKKTKFIEDYELDKGVLFEGVWYTKITL